MTAFTPTTGASAAEARLVVASASALPARAVVLANPITTSFDVVLSPRDQSALTRYIADLDNTASANYHHFLTTTEFATRFGAGASAVASVTDYLRSFHLSVLALSKSHLTLRVRGLTSNIAHAFNAPVASVRIAGHVAAQFTSAATLPATIAREVAGVAGLSSVVTPSSNLVTAHSVATPGTCASVGTASGNTPTSAGGYSASQEAAMYGLDKLWANGDTGVGQTIAVYELGLYKASDVTTFNQCYGITPSLSVVNVDNGPGTTYSDEATMDIEEAGALAPGASLIVYQGPNTSSGPTDVYQQIADDNKASIVTTSWGTCESDPQGDPAAETPIFEQMAVQGQTVISAAGDNGSSDCTGITNNNLAVDDPASQPLVTGVGGLTVSSYSPLNQTVWNTNGGAGGGGVSTVWTKPAWQSGDGIAASATMRMVPDLSVIADPSTGFVQYYTGSNSIFCGRHCSGGWGGIGGTSIGAPLVSALVAAAAQACGTSRLGFLNPTLYAMGTTGFTDVTSGSNDLYSQGSYSAGPGYDMASGLGSPNGALFFSGLCPASFSAANSAFSTSTQDPREGITVKGSLFSSANTPIANAAVTLSVTGSTGTFTIDDDPTSTSANGAALSVTTDAQGGLNVNVTDSSAGHATLSVTYAGKVIYTSPLTFSALSVTTTTTTTPAAVTKLVPGAPTITRVTALAGALTFAFRAPATSGSAAISGYQYSLDGGVTWHTIAAGVFNVTARGLAHGRTYQLVVRAHSRVGAGASSKVLSTTTL